MVDGGTFALERFVHHTLTGRAQECLDILREVCTSAALPGLPAGLCVSEFIWPTLECVQQLRADGSIATRTYNTAIRTLRNLVEALRVSAVPHEVNRSILVLASPNEREELGAHIAASLAEAAGWTVFFAGAGLSAEEISFSVGQLNPDVILIATTLADSAAAARKVVSQLHQIRVWPRVQIAVCGAAAVGNPRDNLGADVTGHDAVDALEVLELCPDFRVLRLVKENLENSQLSLKAAPQIAIAQDTIARLITHFRGLAQHPN